MVDGQKRVVVAMSGGVDSSVAAALLVEQGYQVIGMMLRLWSEPGSEADNRCCTPDAMALARRVASRLGIPFYAIDAQQFFRETVVEAFLEGYAQGITPNPCLVCNRQVRWQYLLRHALSFGAEFMATGHYARLQPAEDGVVQLLHGRDRAKDQSYVLHVLDQTQLQHAMFPLGGYTKPEVRQMARKFGLPVANRRDSMDLCFLGKGDYRDFLRRNAPQTQNPGPIVDTAGNPLGEHQGLANYTIGQRKGLGIAAPQPYYVIAKDTRHNTLVVGGRAQMGQSELTARNVNWISGSPPSQEVRAHVMIRYKATPKLATVIPQEGDQAQVIFDEPLRDITPGQAAVFYQEDICLGGGIIAA